MQQKAGKEKFRSISNPPKIVYSAQGCCCIWCAMLWLCSPILETATCSCNTIQIPYSQHSQIAKVQWWQNQTVRVLYSTYSTTIISVYSGYSVQIVPWTREVGQQIQLLNCIALHCIASCSRNCYQALYVLTGGHLLDVLNFCIPYPDWWIVLIIISASILYP